MTLMSALPFTGFDDMPDVIPGLFPVPRVIGLQMVEYRMAFMGYRLVVNIDDVAGTKEYSWEKVYIGDVMRDSITPYCPVNPRLEDVHEAIWPEYRVRMKGLANVSMFGVINIGFNDLIRYGVAEKRLN